MTTALDTAAHLDALFAQFDLLRPGQAFQLSTDQDPTPVRQALRSRLGVSLVWDVLESGPASWRIQIGKRGASTGSCCSDGACGG